MTRYQREILAANMQGDHTILSVEYPARLTGELDDQLKIVTLVDGEKFVDYYGHDGRTTSQYVARG